MTGICTALAEVCFGLGRLFLRRCGSPRARPRHDVDPMSAPHGDVPDTTRRF